MAAVIELLLQGQLSSHHLLLWLHGASPSGILEELSPQRVEFIPVFLNFLRDESSSLLQVRVSSGTTPNKVPSSVRVTKYVSPGKDPAIRSHTRRQPSSCKGKTLQFLDTPNKIISSNPKQEVQIPDVDQLLGESNSAFTSALVTSSPTVCSSSPSWHVGQKHGKYDTSTPRSSATSPKFNLQKVSPHERTQRGKRQNLDGSDHGGKWGHSSDIKHSEQRLSLGDFITPDVKIVNRKKSPLHRDRVSGGWSLRHPDIPKTLDLSDEEAFPLVGSSTPHDKQQKRRINPTRILTTNARQSSKSSPFSHCAKEIFGVPQSHSTSSPFLTSEEGSKTMDEERELLRQERLKRQESVAKIIRSGESGKVLRKESSPSQVQPRQTDKANNYVQASPDLVTNRNCLDILVKIYAELILYNMTPSVMVELYYLMQMLTVCVIVGTEERSEQVDKCYLSTTHNCVYFATNVLLLILDILKLFDKGTIKLLSENPRVQLFSEELQKHLLEYLESPLPAPVLNQAQKSPIGSVSFQSDTDNRNNFPSGQAFHIFRKQRDMFYEMIRIWEENHLTSGWSYGQALGARIRHLLSLHPSSSNFAHFARLFQSQLLNMCRGDDDQAHWQQDPDGLGLLMLLKKQQPEKYKRLYERLVTPSKFGGPCPPPSFPGSQEFFRDFITTASSYVFNQHLKDVLISHIQMLNDQEFVILEPEETDPVDIMVCGEARSVVLNLRVLAKFLGFLEFLPYQTSEHIPENIVATHIDLRSKVCPPVNLCAALRQCASTGQLVVGVTWMVEFFSMVDPVALHSRHYLTVVMILVAVFRLLYVVRPVEPTGCQVCDVAYTTRSLTPYNGLLLKLLLGWLFDLPNFPDGLFFIDVGEIDIDYLEYSQTLDVLKANYRHLCVTCLRCLFTPTDDVMDRRTAEINTVLTQKGVSPHKDLKPTKGTGLPLTKTPSKQNIKGSPSKTPSKFLSVSMIESPQTTPLKGSDTQIVAERKLNLDESNFVDQQMITICCPFISELKNLLSDYWVGGGCSKGTNSYRKITPLSASDRTTSTHSQMQLQIHLEENFFHNHSTSVRKTTDFVIERISSNVIKNIRTKLIPELRESALEKLKEVIDAATQGSPPCLEWTNDVLQKQVMELCQDMTLQIRKQSSQLALQQSNDEVLTALSLLLPPGISQQGVEVCRKIVCRCSQEKVASWVHSHLTPAVFSKDLTADSDRLLRQAQKAADLQAMALQTSYNDTTISNLELSGTLGTETNFSANQSGPSPLDCLLNSPTNEPRQVYIKAKKVKSTQESVPITVTKHDMDIPSPSTVLSALKELVRTLMNIPKGETPNTISENQIKLMLEEVGKTLTKRQDVTLGVVRAQETLTVDLAVAVAVCVPKLMNSEMQKKFVSLWKPVKDGGVLPNPGSLNSILCSRTVMLVAQNPVVSCQTTAWQKIEELISLLISAELLTPASLLEQCVALLRHTWPQEILSGISSCIEGVSRRALEQKDFHDDPTLLHMLDWVGWVCHQVDDFVDDV